MPVTHTPPSRSNTTARPPVDRDTGEARLRVERTTSDHHCVLAMSGTLDGESSQSVEDEHDRLVESGIDDVVLDCAELSDIDESGAVALAQLWARLRSSGVVCRVRGLHPAFSESPLDLLLYLRSCGSQALAGALPATPRTC